MVVNDISPYGVSMSLDITHFKILVSLVRQADVTAMAATDSELKADGFDSVNIQGIQAFKDSMNLTLGALSDRMRYKNQETQAVQNSSSTVIQ